MAFAFQAWPLLAAKRSLALPEPRFRVEEAPRIKRPNCSLASPARRIPARLKLPGLVMRPERAELPRMNWVLVFVPPEKIPICILLAVMVPPEKVYVAPSIGAQQVGIPPKEKRFVTIKAPPVCSKLPPAPLDRRFEQASVPPASNDLHLWSPGVPINWKFPETEANPLLWINEP